jgi:hypothetical protein
MLLDYISVPVFLASFALGLFFVYVLGPSLKTIYVYPNPDSVDKVLFQDKAGACFRFEEQEVSCPSDSSLLSMLPIQT